MLRVAPKGCIDGGQPVALEEDALLRAAFGRYGGSTAARATAAGVVARYQQVGAGHWFLCDCRPAADCPPALVPVAQTHIRRHQDGRWPVHADTCDFYREPAEQLAITESYAPADDKPLRLARRLDAASAQPERTIVASSHNTARPGIARLLTRLATAAGLQQLDADGQPMTLVDQVKRLWHAARRVEIDAGIYLPEFLCTSPARLDELIARIAGTDPERFKRTRPHGVLIARLAAVSAGLLEPVAGQSIQVRGRLAVFGERPSDSRGTQDERAARAPYLAAVVFGRASSGGRVEALSAYAHPCASERHLTLVDSDLERRTLAQLRSLQGWLGRRQGVRITIEKPLFDLGPSDDAPPRPPCIPDFVVRAAPVGPLGHPVVLVETMGFADENYRTRKSRLHPLMREAHAGAPLVVHDFHEPATRGQPGRDEHFWRELRWALTGPRHGVIAGRRQASGQ